MLIDHIVVNGPEHRHAVQQWRHTLQVFAHPHAAYRRVDGFVVRTCQLLFRVAATLGVERVDLSHASSQPEEDTMLGLAPGAAGGSSARREEVARPAAAAARKRRRFSKNALSWLFIGVVVLYQ